ncbi:GntR family transcriptional regulator [Virgibacillus sp. 179-BFC.A HS]|uniref:GntR family transcriptional regulator n=1 Tax=Tigheibacillus jepli TaxID=3035914 RepID=A0ABU5CMJ7_9BACI|nr:GntR family transcriptional regulator [Virgibacillus sp. 179-BFC.A HS]MDY0407052.1 GntR family transcriptional regulator [Virgibacillus sp. 179-BFC.A HS]
MPIPKNHDKMVRKSAKEYVLAKLSEWIIDGTMEPGEKLNDKQLADALGVSRTPVREALQLLEVEGFVKMYPGKATQVTEVDREAIYDLLPPLAVLQALSVKLAIPLATKETITQLEKTNEEFAEAIHDENYFHALKVDEEFHQIIVQTAANPYIDKIVGSLQSHVRRLFFYNSIILRDKSVEEHKQIIQYMKDGNTEKAADVMHENWVSAIDAFRTLQNKQEIDSL